MISLISSRTRKIKYAIRDLEIGIKPETIKLNIGDPLAYDLKLPKIMEKALIEAVKKGYNFYSDSQGVYELRKKIAEKEKISTDDVVVTSGTSEAINFIFACILNKDDEVLLPTPCYPQYPSMVALWGGKTIFYKCDENWIPDVSDIKKKISKKTKSLVIINPNNPTGAVYPKDVIEEICRICDKNKILIIEDEKVLAEMYKEKLEREGFEVILAFNVKEGIESAKRERPDVILLDILLAGENGIDFLRKQKENQEIFQIPVIAFSNYDDQRAKKEAKELGAKEYLIKTNYTPTQIIKKIKKYLNQNVS